MCRSKLEGGRKCHSHTDPEAIQERQVKRREQYATKIIRDKTAVLLNEQGISFSRGDAVKDAYFQGTGLYEAESFKPITDPEIRDYEEFGISTSELFWSKPEGGLWTAPGRVDDVGHVKTAWTDYAHEEGFSVSDEPLSPIRARKQAIIVIIDSDEDLGRLCKAFPGAKQGFSYEAMAQAGIDGVRLSESGVRSAKSRETERMASFGIWDIDSTVWIQNTNISTGKAVQKSEYPADASWQDDLRDYHNEEYIDDPDSYANQVADGRMTLDDFDFSSFGD